MIVIYGSKTEFKREGNVGQYRCPNCGHSAQQTLCRQITTATLFYFIPIFRTTGQRGVMCENCGVIQPLSKSDYNEKKMLAGQNG